MICLKRCLYSVLFKVQHLSRRKIINILYNPNKTLQWASLVPISEVRIVCPEMLGHGYYSRPGIQFCFAL